MAWTIEQIMEMAEKGGKPMTREQAALYTYCFNEGEKRGVPPTVISMELIQRADAEKNLGKINTSNGFAPKKPSWQL